MRSSVDPARFLEEPPAGYAVPQGVLEMIRTKTIALACAASTASLVLVSSTGAQQRQSSVLTRNLAVFEESICPAPDGNTPFPPRSSVAADPSIPPARVFDNLYFVGNLIDSAWALTTSEGMIVFDAMFPQEVEPVLVGGLRALGLDPADIRYVVVAHGHADHFGGAAHLQDTYGAQVVMSNTEWHYMYDTQADGNAPLPRRDISVLDGDTLTLGDTTVRFVTTPGHTPGTLSSLFTVRDGDAEHVAALWGGTAMNFLSRQDIEVHLRSAQRFAAYDPNIEVVLSNHQYADGTLFKLPALAARAPGQAHPYVVGNGGFREWMKITETCAEAWLDQRRE